MQVRMPVSVDGSMYSKRPGVMSLFLREPPAGKDVYLRREPIPVPRSLGGFQPVVVFNVIPVYLVAVLLVRVPRV